MSDASVPVSVQQWLRELNHFASEMQRLTTEISLLPPEAGEERMARLAQLAEVMSECAKSGARLAEVLRHEINAQ